MLFAGTLPGRAAEPFTYEDEAGDAVDGSASMDIVRVTHDLRQVNRSGPPSLVFEMELAGPPESEMAAYGINSEIEGCGFLEALYRPGTLVYGTAGIAAADFFIECGSGDDSEILPAKFLIDGNVLTWSIALDGLPKALKSSGKLQNLNAFTEITEPFTGEYGTNRALLPMDAASTDKTWNY